MDSYSGKLSGALGAAFLDLKSGAAASVNGDKPFPLASMFKVFVLAEF